MNNAIKGYALGAIAAATYGMNPAFTLPLYAIGIDSESVLLFRYLFAILILGIMLKARGQLRTLSSTYIAACRIRTGICILFRRSVPQLQLYGCRHRFNIAFRISYHGSPHHGCLFPRKIH